jgi:hypothetical protein
LAKSHGNKNDARSGFRELESSIRAIIFYAMVAVGKPA